MKAPRRVFLGALAAAPLVPTGLGSARADARAVSPETGAVVEGLLLVARARFGHDLSPEEIQEVRKGIESVLRSGERLRSVALTNADEPAAIFEARPRGARGGARH